MRLNETYSKARRINHLFRMVRYKKVLYYHCFSTCL